MDKTDGSNEPGHGELGHDAGDVYADERGEAPIEISCRVDVRERDGSTQAIAFETRVVIKSDVTYGLDGDELERLRSHLLEQTRDFLQFLLESREAETQSTAGIPYDCIDGAEGEPMPQAEDEEEEEEDEDDCALIIDERLEEKRVPSQPPALVNMTNTNGGETSDHLQPSAASWKATNEMMQRLNGVLQLKPQLGEIDRLSLGMKANASRILAQYAIPLPMNDTRAPRKQLSPPRQIPNESNPGYPPAPAFYQWPIQPTPMQSPFHYNLVPGRYVMQMPINESYVSNPDRYSHQVRQAAPPISGGCGRGVGVACPDEVARSDDDERAASTNSFMKETPANQLSIRRFMSHLPQQFRRKPKKVLQDTDRASCEVCGKVMARKGLTVHQRIHSGEKRFKCEVCGRLFTQACNMRTHLKVHFQVKEHKCDECGKVFSRAQHLYEHQRIHTGERPYECRFCGSSFKAYSTLYTHIGTHTGHKYQCQVCERTFAKACNLETHIRSKHEEVVGGGAAIVRNSGSESSGSGVTSPGEPDTGKAPAAVGMDKEAKLDDERC